MEANFHFRKQCTRSLIFSVAGPRARTGCGADKNGRRHSGQQAGYSATERAGEVRRETGNSTRKTGYFLKRLHH